MKPERTNGDSIHWIVRIILREICKRLVTQGPLHQARITGYYQIMYEAARQEFCEDNKPTLDGFLGECFKQKVRFRNVSEWR